MPNPISDYFDQAATTWDSTSEPCGVKHHAVAMLAGVTSGARVLDVGCGTGIMVQAYLDLDAASVVGLDLSAEMLARARAKFANQPNVRFEQCDVVEYRAEEPFDVVVIYNAYPHILNKEALVEAVHGLLVPNGRFIVAHGMGRDALNDHHAGVPHAVTSDLLSARLETREWASHFKCDQLVDSPHFYCFGGAKI